MPCSHPLWISMSRRFLVGGLAFTRHYFLNSCGWSGSNRKPILISLVIYPESLFLGRKRVEKTQSFDMFTISCSTVICHNYVIKWSLLSSPSRQPDCYHKLLSLKVVVLIIYAAQTAFMLSRILPCLSTSKTFTFTLSPSESLSLTFSTRSSEI